MNIARQTLERILDTTSKEKHEPIKSIAKRACSQLGVQHISYVGMNLTKSKNQRPYVLHTYPDKWENHYWSQQYIKIDPVVNLGLNSLMPLDWQSLRSTSPSAGIFFKEAFAFGVGNQGITIPIRGPYGDKGLLSFSLNEKDDLWDLYIQENLPDLNILAYYIHQAIQISEGGSKLEVKLSKREIDVLQWLAIGKSKQDVADILNISIHTVKTYAETARYRLNALNTTHAVALAMDSSLIQLPS